MFLLIISSVAQKTRSLIDKYKDRHLPVAIFVVCETGDSSLSSALEFVGDDAHIVPRDGKPIALYSVSFDSR